MPAKSQAQRGLIFSKRDQYKTKAKTPKKWKWVWDEDFENKGKLPKKVTEGQGFEETTGGDAFIDELIAELRYQTKMGFDEAERYYNKYYEFVADCYGDEMSAEDCADALLTKAEKELEETVQNVVFNESNTRAQMVNERFNDYMDDPAEYFAHFEDWLADILGDETDAKNWMIDNGRRVELFRVNGTDPEYGAAEVAEELF